MHLASCNPIVRDDFQDNLHLHAQAQLVLLAIHTGNMATVP